MKANRIDPLLGPFVIIVAVSAVFGGAHADEDFREEAGQSRGAIVQQQDGNANASANPTARELPEGVEKIDLSDVPVYPLIAEIDASGDDRITHGETPIRRQPTPRTNSFLPWE